MFRKKVGCYALVAELSSPLNKPRQANDQRHEVDLKGGKVAFSCQDRLPFRHQLITSHARFVTVNSLDCDHQGVNVIAQSRHRIFQFVDTMQNPHIAGKVPAKQKVVIIWLVLYRDILLRQMLFL